MILSLSPTEAFEALHSWRLWARPEQLAPPGHWQNWLILSGRAWGKTRTGAEWVHEQVWSHNRRRIALVARTAADARDVMVLGESGIMAKAHPLRRPQYEPSKRKLTWPNGAIGITYSAEEPNALRGPQHDAGWCDELASWQYDRDAWDQFQFGLRLGSQPRALITTTPRPTPLIRELVKAENTIVTKGTTFDNVANLAPSFITRMREKFEGTRLGRQELYADVLEDNPGALWNRTVLDALRVRHIPELVRVVIAVDPAVTSNAKSAETGIIACALGADGHGYVLGDYSLTDTPHAWGAAIVRAYRKHRADRVVAEVNQGGDLVEATIRTVDENVSFKSVRATRGKVMRAEPVAALYEQGRIHHIGMYATLEDQMCEWAPAGNIDPSDTKQKRNISISPDRVDALVWGFTELMLEEQFSTAMAPPIVTENSDTKAMGFA